MAELNTDYIRNLHPDWEVVTALCDEVDRLSAANSEPLKAEVGHVEVGQVEYVPVPTLVLPTFT